MTHSVDSVMTSAPAASHTDAAPIAPGDLLENKYEVIRVVGAGAMGSVFECNNLALGRRVAIKVLHRSTAANPVLMRRFYREARIAGSLGHANICRTYDLGTTAAGVPFLVMEFLEGESLAALLERTGELPIGDTLTIIQQVLSALAAAHAVGVVHRDIKPANVFLVRAAGAAPTVKLIDFGISKSASELTQLTRLGHLVGTPAYMAPEQLDGRRIDHRVDLYATGVMMYECVTGQRPFNGRAFDEIVARVKRGLFPTLRLLRADVPPAVEHIILHAMQRDANKRPASAHEMAQQVTTVLSALAPLSIAVHLDEAALHEDDDDPTEIRRPSFESYD